MDRPVPSLDEFPARSFDKLRYCDTDRQGHINNSVFTIFLETGRTEILLGEPLLSEGCAFVIANLNLDYLGEISWPGRVEIGTRVVTVGRSSVTFEQALFQNGKWVAWASTVIVQMDETTRRSRPLSEDAVKRLNAYGSDSASLRSP